MPQNATTLRGLERWSMPPRGVTVEETAEVTIPVSSLEPQIVLRGGMKANTLRDVFYLGPIGSGARTLTVTFGPPLIISTGCFTGTLVEFETEVGLKASDDPHRYEYEAVVTLIKALALVRQKSGEGVPESGLNERDWGEPTV